VSVDVVTFYVAVCDVCGGESEEYETRIEASTWAEAHADKCGVEENDPRTRWEIYQAELDALLNRVRGE
jgi:hypothetical protein